MQNYQLYARILRLVTDHAEHCRTSARNNGQNEQHLFSVAREIIAGELTANGLVWC
jgi:hypothetical protein